MKIFLTSGRLLYAPRSRGAVLQISRFLVNGTRAFCVAYIGIAYIAGSMVWEPVACIFRLIDRQQ